MPVDVCLVGSMLFSSMGDPVCGLLPLFTPLHLAEAEALAPRKSHLLACFAELA